MQQTLCGKIKCPIHKIKPSDQGMDFTANTHPNAKKGVAMNKEM